MYQSKNRKAQRLMPPPGAPGAQPTIFGMEVRFPFRAPTIRRPAPRRNGFPSMAFPAPAHPPPILTPPDPAHRLLCQ